MAKLLTKTEAKSRIKRLTKEINYHDYLYYVLDKPIISDEAYDSLKHELIELEKRFPELASPYSPTQRVGGKPLDKFRKVEHRVFMTSMQDVFSEQELEEWEDYLKRLVPSGKWDYFSELKIDGFAISLIYRDGNFVQGSTRGNGKIGEDVTQNLKAIGTIPLSLAIRKKLPLGKIEQKVAELTKKGEIEIRGEVYMDVADFRKLNSQLEKRGLSVYANPRNLAAGSIRQLDPKLAASRPLKFLAYDIVTDLGQKKHSEEHQILLGLGFKTDPGEICSTLAEVVQYWRRIAQKREKLPFQIDGVVVNVNNTSLFQKFGMVGGKPRGCRAFKFAPKQTTTILRDVKYQVGRTGAITPVAILKPVKIGGTIISRATLHNEDEMKKLGVKIGDTVVVERAGDVIPAVAQVLVDLRTGKEKDFKFPRACPVCGSGLVRSEGEAIWRCENKRCPARKRRLFYHFVSKKAFDIKGLGPKVVNQLMDQGLISEVPEFFKLEEGDLISLERFAEKSAQNLVKAIRNSKRIFLDRFIYALGIHYVGEETAINLARYFGSINELKKAELEDLQKVPDIGETVAKSIYDWFKGQRNLKLIQDLLRAGVEIVLPRRIEKKLRGKVFVFTGGLKNMTRDEAKNRVRMLGGSISSSVSEKTDYVVIGESPGLKLEKAKKLGVSIISEKEFLKLL